MAYIAATTILTQRRRHANNGDNGFHSPRSSGPAPTSLSSSSTINRAAHKLTKFFSPQPTATSRPPLYNPSTIQKDKEDIQSQQHTAHEVVDDVITSAFPSTVESTFSAPTARYSRASRLRRLKGAIGDYKWMNMLDAVQALLGVLSTLLWIVQSYSEYADDHVIFLIQFILSILYILDIIVRLSSSGFLYLYSRWALIDILTVMPVIYTIYQLGWIPADTTADRGFIVFVTALTVVWQFLILARFLRVYKLLRIAELRRFTLWSNNELSRGLSKLLLTVLTIIMLGGGLVFLIENAFPYGESMSFNQSLYFMVVTISTVGYGDITPKTVLGQIAVMCIILFAIVIIPMQTSDFISNLSEYTKYGSAYKPGSIPHVVLVAHQTMTSDDLDTLLHEFFHSNHGFTQYDVVILCNGGEEHRKKLLYHVKSTRFWSQVSYIVGSPSSVLDLQKAAVSRAQACFLITSARFLDSDEELAADEETLLRAVSIKHYCPYVPLIMHILSPRNKAHVLWYQLSKFPNIQVVCLNEMKMKLFATSCMCPGVLGLVTNLLSSYDGKNTLSSLFSGGSANLETTPSSFVSSSTQTFASATLIRNPLASQAWLLSSAKSLDYSSPPVPAPVSDRSSSLFSSSPVRRWEEEYLFGFGQELYTAEFPACVDGYSFSEVAAMLYERLGLVLIGVYQSDKSSGKVSVVLNPGYSCKVSVAAGDLACVIAQNAEHASAMKTVNYAHQMRGRGGESTEIRDRWRRERENDKQRAEEQRERWMQRRKERERRRQERKTAEAFAHRIDIPSTAQPHAEAAVDDKKATAEMEMTERIRRNGRSIPSFESVALSDDEGEDEGEEPEVEGGVMDALSFRCHGQSVVPSMPLSSHIAQTNVQQQAEQGHNSGETLREDKYLTTTQSQSPESDEQKPRADLKDSIQYDNQHIVNPVTGRVTAGPALLQKVEETIGSTAATEEKVSAGGREEGGNVVDVAIEAPELLDAGVNATREGEERKDAQIPATTAGQCDKADTQPTAAGAPSQQLDDEHQLRITATCTSPEPKPSLASPPPTTPSPAPSSPIPTPASPSPPAAASEPSPAVDQDPFSSHVVICGYIDTKIINLIRRFRDSDSRTIVLVFDNAVCFPLPPSVNAYILTHFERVEILFASSSYKARHQKDRLYLAYTSPCYGHHHEGEAVDEVEQEEGRARAEDDERERHKRMSHVANAGSVDGAPTELQGALARMHPPLAVDEYTHHDRRVGQALHIPAGPAVSIASVEHQKQDSPSPRPAGARRRALAYSLAVNGASSHEMSFAEMLAHANWFRRACVHRADSVLILANPYSSPAGHITTSAQSQDSSAILTQHLLSSLLSSTTHNSNMSDEMIKADQYGLLIYSGIQAYLQQCQTSDCPALSVHITSATFNIVNIELIHHNNVRLLRHDADMTENYRPTQPAESGWAWVWRAMKKWWKRRRKRHRKVKRKLQKLQRKAREIKRHFASQTSRPLVNKIDTKSNIDSESVNNPITEEEEEEADDKELVSHSDELLKEDTLFAKNVEQHYKAFYTADGLVFSGKILDALIVQAFYHPLVYDTVSALVGGYTHTIPKPQFAKALERDDGKKGKAESDETQKGNEKGKSRAEGEKPEMMSGNSKNDRTFRVELLLVDVPQVMVGRSYGYLTLKLMLEYGWVCMGLYRDRRAVVGLRKRSREMSLAVDQLRRTGLNPGAPDHRNRQQPQMEQQSSRRDNTAQAPPTTTTSSAQRATSRPTLPHSSVHGSGDTRRSTAPHPSRPSSRAGSSTRAAASATPPPVFSRSRHLTPIEMAEQRRRAESYHVRGLSFTKELTPEQKEKEEQRRQHNAERKAHRRHHHHQHRGEDGADGASDVGADANTRSSSGSDRSTETFVLTQATTIGQGHGGRPRSRSRGTGGWRGGGASSPPAPASALTSQKEESAGGYDDDADHLDTTPNVHSAMVALTGKTFQSPEEEQKETVTANREEGDKREAEASAEAVKAGNEEATGSRQSVTYDRQQGKVKKFGETGKGESDNESDSSSECSSSHSSCDDRSEDADDEDDEDDEDDDLDGMNTPYASRTQFYVLTNPPPDTILHARDRMYVLVQRWLKEETVERMMGHEAMQQVQQAVQRQKEEEGEREEGSAVEERYQLRGSMQSMAARRGGGAGEEGRQEPELHSADHASDGRGRTATESFSIPRSYSAELRTALHGFSTPRTVDDSDTERTHSAASHGPHASSPQSQSPFPPVESSTLHVLQQQLTQQQQMLEAIQKQLAALSAPHQQVTQSPHPRSASVSAPSSHPPSPPHSPASPSSIPRRAGSPNQSTRVHMPADQDGIAYELYSEPSKRFTRHPSPPVNTATSRPSSNTLAPIAGLLSFPASRPTAPQRHVSIPQEPSLSSASSQSSLSGAPALASSSPKSSIVSSTGSKLPTPSSLTVGSSSPFAGLPPLPHRGRTTKRSSG